MNHRLTKCFGRVILRPLAEKDVELLRLLRNRERKWFIYSEEIDQKTQQLWFKKYLKTEDDYMFSVSEVKRPDLIIGMVGLYNFNNMEKTCEFGRIVIDQDTRTEKGLGFDTTVCACKIGFEILGMQRIILEVFMDNIRAMKTYQKTGFITYAKVNGMLKMELITDKFIIKHSL
ncbi:GNAT family N-acetyltransferase [Desulfosporosinus sp. SB140]|uniref:GNAT family N-acetyltransferase n=1 Tax=Desulfosporosinus paludis TaxID=3115649 RepID=UPI00388F8A76